MTKSEFHAHVSRDDRGYLVTIDEIDYVNFRVSEKNQISSEVNRWINELEELDPSDIEVSYIWEKSAHSA